jgi:hypothetical protein
MNENPQSVVRFTLTNSGQHKNDYIKSLQGSVVKDFGLENSVPHRNAQLLLANFILLKVSVPGDPNLTVGSTVNLNIYSLITNGDTRNLDPFYSGKYLISAVRHVLQPSNGMYQTYMELAKDSYTAKLQSSVSAGVK